jgi:type IV pilus assembly protein PilB
MAKAGGDFTEILVRKKILSRDQLVEATAVAKQTGARVQDALIKLGYCTAQEVKNAIAEHHGLQFIDLTEVTIPQAVIELVPESVARENYVLPMAQDNGALKMIMSDPFDVETVQKLQFILNRDIQPVLAIREQIIEAIDRHYGPTETESVDAMLVEFTDTAIEFTDTEAAQPGAAADDSDPRVVKLVDLIIAEAITLRASDIHIEPLSDRVRVRYRIDGVLVERESPPRRLLDPLLSRIKFMSNINTPKRPQPQAGRIKRLLAPLLSRTKIKSAIDTSEHPEPQGGRIKLRVQGEYPYYLRVSILPTQYGESAVLRILDHSKVYIGVRELGLGDEENQRLRQAIKRPSGIFLVTGPPGSGKTTTLYAVLNELNRPDRKIITAEDPVEYDLPGIAQWQIQHDLTFANALQSILRQSPDIILLGEIRDHETAQIAVQAALSGRMVLSTLDTASDAPSTITRLADFGVPPFLIASSVTAIKAQRLVRVVCPKCKQPDEPGEAEIKAAGITPDQLAGATFMRGLGCNDCDHTGYRGRLGIFELLKLNAALREMIFNREPTQAIRRRARQLGMRTLLEDGVHKALMGITTLEEVFSACHHELETRPRDVLTTQPP